MTTAEPDHQLEFLRRLQRRYIDTGVPNRWAGPEPDVPYSSLILQFTDIGENHAAIDLELCFLPGMEALNREGVEILQSFAVLRDQLPQDTQSHLLAAIAPINFNLPLGAFGLSAETGTLYFKHNAMLHRAWLEAHDAPLQIDRQNAMLLHQLHLFADSLLGVE